jgi:dTDP-glucose 4,6-dehydratase
MRILITGGAGFIGSNFVRMISRGEFSEISHVTVLDKLTYAGNLSNLSEAESLSSYEFVEGDICDPDLVQSLLTNIDAVINFAAESHVDRSIGNANDFVTANVMGVYVLLDAIKSSGRNLRFIQISTDEVYGSIDHGAWREDSPILPNSPYSASKAGGELIARSYHKTHGLDVIVTRCSNNYGTHHFPEKLIPLFVTNLIEGRKIPIYGNGLNVRDWLHVDDHCRGINLALTLGRSGEIYNIGGGLELTNLEITDQILEIMGVDKSSIKFVEDRKGHDFRYSVDWSKINQELGYEPKVSFEDGLKQTIKWYQENESWWRPLKSSDQ